MAKGKKEVEQVMWTEAQSKEEFNNQVNEWLKRREAQVGDVDVAHDLPSLNEELGSCEMIDLAIPGHRGGETRQEGQAHCEKQVGDQ